MKPFLFVVLVMLYGTYSEAQVISASIEDRSRYLMHSVKWSSREKQGFQDGNNIIQVEKTGTKLQTGYTVRFDGVKHAVILRKISPDDKEIMVNKLEGGERVFGPIRTTPIEFGEKILLFYYKYIDKDSMKLYVSEIDRNNLQLINTKHLFSYQQDNVGIFKLMKALDREIIFKVSTDGTKLLVVAPGKNNSLFSCVLASDLQVLRKKTSDIPDADDLTVSAAFLDGLGNSVLALSIDNYSYTTFSSTILKKLLVQKSNNSDRLIDVSTFNNGTELCNARFGKSKIQDKVFLIGDYAGTIAREGVWLSEIQLERSNITKPKMVPYPENFKKRVYETGFGIRKKGEYGILDANLKLTELENGDLVICGSPLLRHDGTHTDSKGRMSGYITYFAGPVMIAFLKEKKDPVFTMIPRHQHYCGGSESIFLPYQDKLVVIYSDYAKNINAELSDKVNEIRINMVKELSLAAAVVNRDGAIESRKLLAEGVSRMNYYNTSHCEFISNQKLLIPSASLDKKTEEQKVVVVTVD